jgi:hypothetical protein
MPLLRERCPFLGEIWFVGGNQGTIPSISKGSWVRILGQGMILGKILN